MLNKKFVFAVSLVAMMAVSNAWASAPATGETVSTTHSVFDALEPTEAGSKAGIAGVTYVNRAVNSAGNAAIAAENHAAASGAYAIDAKTAAQQANTAAAAAKAAADAAQATASEGVTKANAAQQTADSKVSIAQGTANAGKGLVVDATSGNLTLTDVATQAELNAVSSVASAAQTAGQVSSAISTAIGNLDGNTETTGTNDGKYVTAVTQSDGKITPSVVAFDTTMSSSSTNAVQNKVVNTALGTKENVSNKVTGDTFGSDEATRKVQYPSVYSTFAIANTVSAASKAELSGVIDGLDDRVAANERVIDTLGTLAYEDTVTSALITDGAVATADIAGSAVTSDKIADKTIVNADVADNAAIAASKISGLATVATSGSYSDLSGKPAINNATLTIKKNGTSVGTFTANASANNEINITVPTTVASLTDAGSYATVAAMNTADAKKVNVAQGSSAVNKAVITDASGDVTTGTIATGMITDGAVTSAKIADKTIVNADVADNAAIAASKIAGLATVATSGSYSDLSDKPAINNATLTIKKNGTSVGTFAANASANNEINITVPTTVASLTDAGSYATVAAMNTADAKKVSIAQGTTNAGKGLVVDATSGNLTLTDVATQAELDAVSGVANAAQTAGQVSSAISTAIGNLDGNAETTGTNDGKYVTAVTQSDGKITPSVVAFDTSMSSSSTNAVQNKVVNTALGTKENVSNKVTALSANSTDTQYPSAKLVYTELAKKQNNLTIDTAMSSSSTNPVQNKVVNTALGTKENVSNKVTGDTFAGDDATRKVQYPSVYSTFAIANTVSAASKAELSGVIDGLDDRVAANEGVIDTLGTLAYEDTVTSALITDGAVATADIAGKAVTAEKIADQAVTAVKTSGVIGKIPSGSATASTYADIWVE